MTLREITLLGILAVWLILGAYQDRKIWGRRRWK